MGDLKSNILSMQYEIYKKLKKRVDEYERKNRNLKQYELDYLKEVSDFVRVMSKDELVSNVASSDVVFIGDFHTLRQAQKIPVRILDKVIREDTYKTKKKGIVLCMEAFLSEYQKYLNLYLDDKLSEQEFLMAIEYEKTWGQNWKHYKSIIDFAKSNKIKVFGINTQTKESSNSLKERDNFAIEKIMELLLDFPKHLVVVFYGDAHICTNHIPKKLEESLSKRFRKKMNYIIIHQNSDNIYWKLAKLGIEDMVDAVYIAPRVYCIMNTTPIAKLQSQLNWYENKEELECILHPDWCDPVESVSNLCDEVKDIIDELTKITGKKFNYDDLSVLCIHNVKDLMKVIPKELTPSEIKKIETVVLKNESYFLPKKNIIILTNYSINHVAEEAMHYIHSKMAKYATFDNLNLHDRFYSTIIYEAIGYCGSKIINHKRKCYKIKDFYDYLLYLKNRKIKDKKTRNLKQATKKVIIHYEMEQMILNRGRKKNLGKFFDMRYDLFITTTHAIGYMLGDRLYYGLINGVISKDYFLKLLKSPIQTQRIAYKCWFELIQKLKNVKETYISKEEIL